MEANSIGRRSNMQALILVGGEATRLRPLTCHMPKAMVPVMNTPFLEHVIRYLGIHGIDDVVLAQGHLPKLMDDYFKDGSRFGTKLTYSLETKPLNTAGAVKNAEKCLSGRFFVLNGDIFTDLDLTSMLQFHVRHKSKATIALTPVEDPTAFGIVETTPEGRVKRFLEKPNRDQITTNMINAGIYILENEILQRIPADTNYSFERQLFPDLLQNAVPFFAFSSHSYWIDIGKPDTYLQTHRDLLAGLSRGYRVQSQSEIRVGANCQIDSSAILVGPLVMADNCRIGPGAKITGPAVFGPGVTVQNDCLIESSVLWQNTLCCTKSSIKGSLIANDCTIGAECVMENSVVGDHIQLTTKTRLGPGSRIWPG
jgi:mannose-1-phosphate guanylyltransferase